MLTLLRSVGGAARAGSLIPAPISRAIASNGNLFPYSFINSTSNVQNYKKLRTVPQNADFTDIKLTYANFMVVNASESVNSLTDITVRAGIEYNGTFYPVTFSGSRDTIITPGSYQESDAVAGLTLPAGAQFYERIRIVGQAGSQAYIYANNSKSYLKEGRIVGTDTAVDFTLGGEGDGATATPNVSGGVINSATLTNGGSQYTSSPALLAYEVLSDGTIKSQTVGYGIRSGGQLISAYISNGGSGWTNPILVFAGGNSFGQNALIYSACLITGQPSTAVNSLLIIGDSIAQGGGVSDIKNNFGIYEQGVDNRFGVGNMSTPGNTAAGHVIESAREKMYEIYGSLPTHVLIQNATNDFASNLSKIGVVNNNGTIASLWRSRGASVSYAAVIPRTSSTDSWTTLTGQTEATQHGVGEHAPNYNSDLRTGTITSDWNIVDTALQAADNIQPTKWRIDQAATLTNDGVHPGGLGVPFLSSQIENYFNPLA